MSRSLVQPLFGGPLDIVGDVHGEIDALRSLLDHLGYNKNGFHADGRRLVFLGDLTDRGPDSPAVVDLVCQYVESGNAQCVLGNHDFNILLGERKYDNGWFFGQEFRAEDGTLVEQKLADDSIQAKVVGLFSSLPLALERDDLRVVHACWCSEAIEQVRPASSVIPLYDHHVRRIDTDLRESDDLDAIDRGLRHQNHNPVKLLLSGPEERIEKPIEASGKIRYERRVHWWEDYSDDAFCVFGHYSLPHDNSHGNGQAYCVDFGVGKRWTERQRDDAPSRWKLAALRIPERVVVFDDGSTDRVLTELQQR